MDAFEVLFRRAREHPRKVALPEADTAGIILAAREAADLEFCTPYLLGDPECIQNTAQQLGVSLEHMVIVDTTDREFVDHVIQAYLKTDPLLTEKALKRKASDPLYIALMMEAIGEVDCTFAGFTHTTASVLMAGNAIIGLSNEVSFVSSMGILDIPGYEGEEGSLIVFADCGYHVDPTSEELADIAILTCDNVKDILGWDTRCALLSYSTTGSASGPHVDKVIHAVRIANEKRPDLLIDGEFQLDAAVDPEVAAKKVTRESAVAGRPNILIFPDLNAGNIGIKLVHQFARASALYPISMGFAKPLQDCSRGARVQELVGEIAVACLQVKEKAL